MTFPEMLDVETQNPPLSDPPSLLMQFFARCASERLKHWLGAEAVRVEVRHSSLKLMYGDREVVMRFYPEQSLWSLSTRPECLEGFDRGLKILRRSWTLCRAEQEALS